jgi:FkbM family methyltransferase
VIFAPIERVRRRAMRIRFYAGVRPRVRRTASFTRLGSPLCGWVIPGAVDPAWRCYTVGVGEDASFDVALAEHGCEVVAIDPTPDALRYVEPIVARTKNLSVLPYALWDRDGTLELFAPVRETSMSFSVVGENWRRSGDPIEVQARTLASIAQELDHDRIDLLKLDIEGAEYPVLAEADLVSLGVKILCVEFHNTAGVQTMLASVRNVERQGYRLAHLHRTDVTFCRADR